MKLICPNNEGHKQFTVIAHVTQLWLTDDSGLFVEVIEDCVDVTYSPNSDDLWVCNDCGAEAIQKGAVHK